MKTKGFSFVEFAPVFEQLFGKNAIDGSVEKFLTNLINYEIPKSISLISICISLLIEQQLVSHTKKKEELKYLIKPISSARLSRGFSWITIIAIYSLLILKFVLRIKNFPLELILYNIFYLLTTIHFINGIGVIAYYYNLKIVPILNTNLIPQIKTRPFTLLLIILAIFVIILFLMPFFIYIYFVIAFISTVDTIYLLRKENVL